MSTLDIHIVTYNNAATIEDCLQAALLQSGVRFHVRVLDNHSQDDTVRRARSFGVEVIASPHNTGYTGGHNALIQRSSAEYVLTLNPDVLLLPGFLSAVTDALDHEPQAGSAASCLLRVDHLGDEPAAIDSLGLFMRRSRRQGLLMDGAPVTDCFNAPREVFGVDGAAAVYRRSMLDDICDEGEIFDEDFFMHKEDVDVAWRARLRGWTSVHVPDAVAHHIRSFRPGKRERVSAFMRFLGARNRYLVMLKNEIGAHFRRDLPYIGAYDAGIIGYMLLREWGSLHAFISLGGLWRHAWRKRQFIQSRRRVEWQDIARWFV